MWRIFGEIFCGDKDRFFNYKTKRIDKAGIQKILTEHKIGIGETVIEAIRTKDNASDKFLEIVKRVDLSALFSKIPDCRELVTTGEKAASVIAGLTCTKIPKVGEFAGCECEMPDGSARNFRHWRMPSTSRAYPMKLEEKTAFYKNMFRIIGII